MKRIDAILCVCIDQSEQDCKVRYDTIALSGGLTLIKDIDKCASKTYGTNVVIPANSAYLSAIGAALYAERL